MIKKQQDNFHKIADSGGLEDSTYSTALRHIQKQCRDNGIDAALRMHNDANDRGKFDALLLCDRKGAGQQLAAQAGMVVGPTAYVLSSSKITRLSDHQYSNRP